MDSSISGLLRLPVIAPRPKTAADVSRKRHTTRSQAEAKDRRATPRVQVELECEELAPQARLIRVTSDLSTFGLATRFGAVHPIHTLLKLLLYLPDGDPPLALTGRVVGRLDARGGMRIAFRSPSRDAVRRIHRYLARQRRR